MTPNAVCYFFRCNPVVGLPPESSGDRANRSHPPLQTTEHLLHLSDIADSLSYIKLATDTSNLIGVIDKIIPLKDRILIVDKDITQTIYIFDKSGKFIRKINKKAEGPENI